MSKKLYGYAALFDKPDDIMNAAAAARDEGFTKWDVNTPYPLHGMDAAMGLSPSKMGFFTLAFALTGFTIGISGITWIVTKNYPMVIGGKPYWSLPSYIPILFECTVLLGAVLSVLWLLFVFLGLPGNGHDLHETEYMDSVADDKFGLIVEADDAKFEEGKIKSFFEKLNASKIIPIYKKDPVKNNLLEPVFLASLVVVAVVVSGGIYGLLNKAVFLRPFNWYTFQDKVMPQTQSSFFEDGYAMRLPVEGTVSRGNMPYLYADDPDTAGELMSNPLLANEETLRLGKEKFNINCSACHGYYGKGDSRLRGQFPTPPSLHSKKVKEEWTDGRIYHVITMGQNVMPSQATRLSPTERWAVIHYIRALQRSLDPQDGDEDAAKEIASQKTKPSDLANNNDSKAKTVASEIKNRVSMEAKNKKES